MNDFGLFPAIQTLVRKDPFLSKITTVVTEPRPGMTTPYMEVRFEKAEADIPCLPQSALVTAEIRVISNYHGDQEIHELMSRLDFCLNGARLPVEITALNARGAGVFKSLGQNIKRESGNRIGTLRYQIKINIRRD